MYNDFVLVGPTQDPGGAHGMPIASEALAVLAGGAHPFASRGDDSGTHARERELWSLTGVEPAETEPWYVSLGQGMAATLQFAQERGAYTLTDRGTYLALHESLPDLEIHVGGGSIAENADPDLRNPYAVIALDPARHPHTDSELAQAFIDWLTGVEVQAWIGKFGLERYGQPLFYPDSLPWRAYGS
jgi:tungstate transport system substrate-binding protein